QRGFSYFFPPEVMGSHIGARHCHATRRVSDIHFRGITALFGHMGIELDPVKESAQEKAGFAKYIALHKQYRELLHTGTTYRIAADDGAQMIHGVVAADQSAALVMVALVDMQTYALGGVLRVPGLAADRHYRVKLVAQADNFHQGLVNQQPAWTHEGIELTGEWLTEVGLAMPVLDPSTAILIEFTAL
ncbi:MAG: alpha-galactosidase, partial [Aeromonas sp.]